MASTYRSGRSSGLAQSLTKLVLLASSTFPLLGKPLGHRPGPIVMRNLASLFHITYDLSAAPHGEVPRGTPEFWWMMALIIVLVLLGGCFAGLTLGKLPLQRLGSPLILIRFSGLILHPLPV